MLRIDTVTHAYDDDNRAVETTYPNGKVVDRAFTARNQLDQVDYDASMVASFTYDAGMRETRRDHGNTLITRRVYGRSEWSHSVGCGRRAPSSTTCPRPSFGGKLRSLTGCGWGLGVGGTPTG